MNKKESLAFMKQVNNDIFKSIVQYLTGPKSKSYYDIEYSPKNYSRIVRVYSKSKNGVIAIYFGKSIYIKTSVSSVNVNASNSYVYFEYNDQLPKDIEEYKQTTKMLLIELIRHINNLQYIPESYNINYSFLNCSKIKVPENFDVFDNSSWYNICENLALYPYTYEEKDIVLYMIDVFKSKKFKRFRGDNE